MSELICRLEAVKKELIRSYSTTAYLSDNLVLGLCPLEEERVFQSIVFGFLRYGNEKNLSI